MITVLGSINFDLIGGVDRLPRPGETVPGSSFATAAGGKGANQALAAARADARVRMIGAVGRDEFAGPALALLREGGVDLGSVRQINGPTGVALILVDSSGENVIAVIPGANGTVADTDTDAVRSGLGDVLLLQLEVPVGAIESAARKARAGGASVLLNFAPYREDALGVLPNVTHLIVNETECALVSAALGVAADSTEAQAVALGSKLGIHVVATLGADGAVAFSEGQVLRAKALPVQVIDTVGAGDTFCGYLAAALAGGNALGEAIRLAAAAGSLACAKSGAQPSVPTRAEVERALAAAPTR